MQNKLTKIQIHLELDPDLTRFQPPQVPVVNADDGSTRIILLTTAELLWKHRAIQSGCFGHTDAGAGQATPPSNVLQGSDFRVSERYRCLADHRGQVQGGVGFIFEGKDIADGSKVSEENWPSQCTSRKCYYLTAHIPQTLLMQLRLRPTAVEIVAMSLGGVFCWNNGIIGCVPHGHFRSVLALSRTLSNTKIK